MGFVVSVISRGLVNPNLDIGENLNNSVIGVDKLTVKKCLIIMNLI